MYHVTIIEKGKKRYIFHDHIKSVAEEYAFHMFDYFKKMGCKPVMKTVGDEIGDVFIRVFQDSSLIKRR